MNYPIIIGLLLMATCAIGAENSDGVFRKNLEVKIDQRVVQMLSPRGIVRSEREKSPEYYRKKVSILVDTYLQPVAGNAAVHERALHDADRLITSELDSVLSRDIKKLEEWSRLTALQYTASVKDGLMVKVQDRDKANELLRTALKACSDGARAALKSAPIILRTPPFDQGIARSAGVYGMPFERAPIEAKKSAAEKAMQSIMISTIDISVDMASIYFDTAGDFSLNNLYYGSYGVADVIKSGPLSVDKAQALMKEIFVKEGKIDMSDAPIIPLFVLQRMQAGMGQHFKQLFPGGGFRQEHAVFGEDTSKIEKQEVNIGKP